MTCNKYVIYRYNIGGQTLWGLYSYFLISIECFGDQNI